MSLEAYTNPDFGTPEKLIFLSLSLVAMALCSLLILAGAAVSTSSLPRREKKAAFSLRAHNLIQRFYEMMISATSVMSFASAYVILNHIYSVWTEQGGGGGAVLDAIMQIWGDWKDFVLLLLICLSCVLNSLLDIIVIRLKHVSSEEKASVRLLGMFYAILILIWLNQIGDESEYNPVMMYYLGLMVGRFVYFDASFSDFLHNVKNAFKNLPLLIMGLLSTAVLCSFGFSAGYLLERNYYIVGVFYTHLFMLAAVFILHHSHIFSLIAGKVPKEEDMQEEPEGYGDEYEEEYDDYQYEGYDEYGYDDSETDQDLKWMQ